MLIILEVLLLAALAVLAALVLRRILRLVFSSSGQQSKLKAKSSFDHKSATDAAEDVASYGTIAAIIAKVGIALASPGAIGTALMWLGLANVPLLLTIGPIILYFTGAAIATLAALKLYGKRELRKQQSRAIDDGLR